MLIRKVHDFTKGKEISARPLEKLYQGGQCPKD
jgi:hypothetical protein